MSNSERSSLSVQALAAMAASQNLPAVLNDPGKGRQKFQIDIFVFFFSKIVYGIW